MLLADLALAAAAPLEGRYLPGQLVSKTVVILPTEVYTIEINDVLGFGSCNAQMTTL